MVSCDLQDLSGNITSFVPDLQETYRFVGGIQKGDDFDECSVDLKPNSDGSFTFEKQYDRIIIYGTQLMIF